jgi:uncharacterized membrane protein HdeD (DUF308 family)
METQDLRMQLEENVQKHWGWFLFLGIIFIIGGTIAIIVPTYASMSLELILGWILVFSGIFQLFHSFGSKKWGAFFLRFFGSLLYLAAGVMLLLYPLGGLVTLTLLLAALLTAQGIFRIVLSFQIKKVGNWGWMLVGGLLSLALGIMIYAQWPSSSLWILGLFLGIDLIFAGWTLVMLSMASRKFVLRPAV